MAKTIDAMVFDISCLRKCDALDTLENIFEHRGDVAGNLSFSSVHNGGLKVSISSEDLPAGLTFDNGIVGWTIFSHGNPAAILARQGSSYGIFYHGSHPF